MGADLVTVPGDTAGVDNTRGAVRLGLVTSLLLGMVLGGLTLIGALDPVQLLLPGQKGAGGSVMVEDFGADRIPDGYSYDGQQYYLAARYFPDVEAAGAVVGGPRFRLLRIGLPALASPAGDGTGVVLLLIAWNIVGTGLAVGALADLAQRHGRSAPVGAAAGAALALPLLLTTAECLALGLGFLALDLAHRERVGLALVVLAAAGLTRETTLTLAVGMLVFWIARRRYLPVLCLPLAAIPLVLWRTYLHRLIPEGGDAPLGWFDLLDVGRRPLVDQAVTATIILLGVLAAIHWRDANLMWPVALASLAWFAVYEYDTFDWRALPRVTAPLVALGLAGLASWWLAARDPEEAAGTGLVRREETGTRRRFRTRWQ